MEIYEFSQIEHQLAPVFERHGCEAEQILQILLDVQEIYYFIPNQAITYIASHLNVARVRVEEVAGFYSFLSLKPMGEYRLLFSDNITDQAGTSARRRERKSGRRDARTRPREDRSDGRATGAGRYIRAPGKWP